MGNLVSVGSPNIAGRLFFFHCGESKQCGV